MSRLIDPSFSHLGNSGNTVISVKGKGLTNIKIYVERKVLSKGISHNIDRIARGKLDCISFRLHFISFVLTPLHNCFQDLFMSGTLGTTNIIAIGGSKGGQFSCCSFRQKN